MPWMTQVPTGERVTVQAWQDGKTTREAEGDQAGREEGAAEQELQKPRCAGPTEDSGPNGSRTLVGEAGWRQSSLELSGRAC